MAALATDDPFAGLMEKNMSKSNESSKLGRTTQVRELRDDELDVVSGGKVEGKVEANSQEKTILRQAQAVLAQM